MFSVGCEKCGGSGELLFNLPGNVCAKICVACRNDAVAWVASTDAFKRCIAWSMQYEGKLFSDFDSALKISQSWIKEEEEIRRILQRWLSIEKIIMENPLDFEDDLMED
jgi:hypothetical protein